MTKIKLNDKVVILAGKDKGKVGIVSKVFIDKIRNKKFAVIEGVNLFKKHTRSVPSKNKVGGIVSVEVPIDFSNVALFCASSGKQSKVFFNFLDNGKKSRFFKSNRGVIN